MNDANEKVHAKLLAIYDTLYRHNGFGEMTVEVRILKKQQKEVIIKCGKQFRCVVDWKNTPCPEHCPLCDNDSDPDFSGGAAEVPPEPKRPENVIADPNFDHASGS